MEKPPPTKEPEVVDLGSDAADHVANAHRGPNVQQTGVKISEIEGHGFSQKVVRRSDARRSRADGGKQTNRDEWER